MIEKLVEKINLPIIGDMYIANSDIASMETLQDLQEPLKKLYEYEQLEEQSLLVKLPCKIGDKVYWVNDYKRKYKDYKIDEQEVWSVIVDSNKFIIDMGWNKGGIYGETVFSTREEAELVLKKLK